MLYENLFRLLPVPVALIDDDLVIVDACEEFEKAAGARPGGLHGVCVFDRFLVDGRSTGDRLTDLLAAEEALEYRAGLAAGETGTSPRTFLMRILGVDGEGGRHGLVVLSSAEERETASRLDELYARIRLIKHEINNPLTGALGNITLLLRRNDLDEKTQRRLITAERELKKIGETVSQLAHLVPGESQGRLH